MGKALADYLQALADDELVLGHRNSEWCGHAPILEEDIAFANLALDEIGHARLWLELAAKELGEEPARYPDRQVFFRPAAEFRNLQMLELPNGDWAFSMLRQYLFDSFESKRLDALKNSSYKGVAEVAARVRNEEIYHLRHTQAWVKRLAMGTEESQRRSQAALDALWPYSEQMALPMPGEDELVGDGIAPESSGIFLDWRAEVAEFLQQSGLRLPDTESGFVDRSQHSEHLEALLAEMQEVARLDVKAGW